MLEKASVGLLKSEREIVRFVKIGPARVEGWRPAAGGPGGGGSCPKKKRDKKQMSRNTPDTPKKFSPAAQLFIVA